MCKSLRTRPGTRSVPATVWSMLGKCSEDLRYFSAVCISKTSNISEGSSPPIFTRASRGPFCKRDTPPGGHRRSLFPVLKTLRPAVGSRCGSGSAALGHLLHSTLHVLAAMPLWACSTLDAERFLGARVHDACVLVHCRSSVGALYQVCVGGALDVNLSPREGLQSRRKPD